MPEDRTMVPLREYFEALQERDKRALDLLAKTNADRINTQMVIASIIISIASIVVAIAAVILERH